MAIRKMIACSVICILLGSVTLWAADIDLTDVKCVVAPKAATMSKSADYKEAKVYFCCGNCQAKFNAKPEDFATPANHQLVATHQFEQKACPISGKPVDESQSTKVSDVTVKFCCGNCKGAVEKAESKQQLDMVFGEKPFEKAFAKVAPAK